MVKVILDEYVTKNNIPKTCAKKVYKLTEKELELIPSRKKAHGYYRTAMTLYTRSKVITLACKKYGCTRKNIAEVLAQENPTIVNPLIEKPKKKTPEKKNKKAQNKNEPEPSSSARAESPLVFSNKESSNLDSTSN